MSTAAAAGPLLVGRSAALAGARELASRVLDSRAQALTVDGPPGIGKSTLASHVAAELRARGGWRVLVVSCLPGDAEHPGVVAERIVTTIDAPVTSSDPLPRLVEAFNSESIATCLVIEDVQWIDDATADAMLQIAEVYQAARAFFIVTARTGCSSFFERVKNISTTGMHGAHLTLPPLDPQDIGRLATTRLGVPVPREFARRVHRATGGSPLHVAVVLDQLDTAAPGERDLDQAISGLGCVASQRAGRFDRAVAQIVEASDPSARAALELLSFAERPLSLAFVDGRLAAEGLAPFSQSALLRTGLVRMVDETRVTSVHVMVSRSVRATASWRRSSAWHAALAEQGTRQERLRHRLAVLEAFPEAEDAEGLVDEFAAEGASALDRGAFPEAFELFAAALSLAPRHDLVPLAVRAAVHSQRPELLGRIPEDVLAVADPQVRAAVDALLAAESHSVEQSLGHLDAGIRRRTSAGSGESAESSEGTVLLAHAASRTGRLAAALGQFGHGQHIFDTLVDRLAEFVDALPAETADPRVVGARTEMVSLRGMLRCWAMFASGDWPGMPAIAADVRAVADELAGVPGADVAELGIRTIVGSLLHHQGRPREAHQQLQASISAASHPQFTTHSRMYLALLHFEAGLLDEAHAEMMHAFGGTLLTSEDAGTLYACAVAALTTGMRDDGDRAARFLRRIEEAPADLSGGPGVDSTARVVRAWLAVRAGDDLAAAHHLMEIDENAVGWRIVGPPPAMLLARALAATGRTGDLPALIERLEDPTLHCADVVRAALTSYVRGLLAVSRDDSEDAVRRLLDAVDHFDAVPALRPSLAGMPGGGLRLYRSVAALDAAAQILADPGASPAAAGRGRLLASQAAHVLAQSGLARLAEQARGLGAAESPPRDRPGRPGHTGSEEDGRTAHVRIVPALECLTRREEQIAYLVSDGLSNREIAEALVVSVRTVEYHVRNALRKLQLPSRIELRRLIRTAGR
ncbi:hypothetical protein GCM10027060_06070 [Nesterenkonia halophila]